MDAFADPGPPDAFVALPPAAARPPAPPPDLSSIIYALAAERPGDLEGSCVMTGGTHAFLFEAVRRMRAIDPRWGLDREGAGIVGDHVTYYWGDGAPEGATEVYVLDVIARLCSRPGIDAPLVRRLRATDPRWGLNWKRGVVGDMSQDVVDYYFAPGDPVEGSTDVYIIDVIGGHCGPSPSPAFTDVTEATRMGGTIGRWTLAGRSDLGP